MPKDGVETIRVPLTPTERADLKQEADRHHRTMGGQAAVIIQEWLKRQERRREA